MLTDSFDYGLAKTIFSESHVQKLEQWIDQMDNQLPELKNFILPVSCTMNDQLVKKLQPTYNLHTVADFSDHACSFTPVWRQRWCSTSPRKNDL